MTISATPAVGDEVAVLVPGVISRSTLALFAGASGDHNPIHIDLDSARASGMDDVFAHGMLSMAYLGRVLTNTFRQEQIREFSARFTAITPVLAEPVLRATVQDVAVVDGEERVTLAVTAELADGTQTLAGTAVVALS